MHPCRRVVCPNNRDLGYRISIFSSQKQNFGIKRPTINFGLSKQVLTDVTSETFKPTSHINNLRHHQIIGEFGKNMSQKFSQLRLMLDDPRLGMTSDTN